MMIGEAYESNCIIEETISIIYYYLDLKPDFHVVVVV